MIIYGWGKVTVKKYGEIESNYCNHCSNLCNWSYGRYRTWFTLFFIPIIPYKTDYVKECPTCGSYAILDKEEFFSKVKNINSSTHTSDNTDTYSDGLTETQRNYKKQVAELKSINYESGNLNTVSHPMTFKNSMKESLKDLFKKPSIDKDGNMVMKPPKVILFCGLFLALLTICIIILGYKFGYSLEEAVGTDEIFFLIAGIAGAVLGMACVIYGSSKVVISNESITSHKIFNKKSIEFYSIEKVKYARFGEGFLILKNNTGKKIWISMGCIGIASLVDLLCEKIGEEKSKEAIDAIENLKKRIANLE